MIRYINEATIFAPRMIEFISHFAIVCARLAHKVEWI